jgi:ribosome-associated translation inhibitor RaiA
VNITQLKLRSEKFDINNNNNNNKPDIIIRGSEKRTCMSIDVEISGDRNVIRKEDEKILNNKDITIEIQHMWNVKASVIPVITGATGTISKSFRKYVSDKLGNHDVKELKETAIMGTAHILREVLT